MRVPKVSIGLPVYNGERYLPAVLDSILRQDWDDFELIISDNASSDGTRAICQDFAARDPRIRYSRNETNIGATANYNRVFELARGEYFKWASHDDEFHPSLLCRCLETYGSSPSDTVLVFSKADIIDDSGQVLCPSHDTINATARGATNRLASLIFHRCYAHPLWGLIRSQALRRTRLMGRIEADHVLLAELVLQGPIVEIPELLYRERLHSGSAQKKHLDAHSLLVWHDPSQANVRFLLPYWMRWDLEYWKAIRRAPLSPVDRLLCYAMIPSVRLVHWLFTSTRPLRHWLGMRRREFSSSPEHASKFGSADWNPVRPRKG